MRETSSGCGTTSWETALAMKSVVCAGTIIRYSESMLSPNGGWMFHCEGKTCQRLGAWDTFVIPIDLLTQAGVASWELKGELLPFPIVSQIKRRGCYVEFNAINSRKNRRHRFGQSGQGDVVDFWVNQSSPSNPLYANCGWTLPFLDTITFQDTGSEKNYCSVVTYVRPLSITSYQWRNVHSTVPQN